LTPNALKEKPHGERTILLPLIQAVQEKFPAPACFGTGIAENCGVFIKNGISGIAGYLDLAIVPIKSVLVRPSQSGQRPLKAGVRKVALMEEGGGVSVEKLLLSGEAAAVQPMAIEMIKAGRKMVLEGFPLEEIAAWCFKHNYRWRFHNHSPAKNTFILEPGKNFVLDAKEAGAKT